MGSSWRLRTIAGVLVLAAGLGCNPLTTVYFMMVGVENKAAPEFKRLFAAQLESLDQQQRPTRKAKK